MIPAYSVSKPFLAQAVLELGLDLDSEIGRYLEELSAAYAGRRISQLLNHTSGLDDYSAMPDYNAAVERRESAWPIDELLTRAEALTHGNEGFHYSNIGYLLLSLLAQKCTGKGYFDSLNELVFEPLKIEGFAEWHSPHPEIPDYDPAWVYSGTFLAEPDALAAGLTTLAQHRQQTIGMRAGLFALSLKDTGFDQPGYNYGFMVDGGSDGRPAAFAGHGGGGPGFQHVVLTRIETGEAGFQAIRGEMTQRDAIALLRLKLQPQPRPIARRLPKRMLQLQTAAELFDKSQSYTEAEVNARLKLLFDDHVFARRLLIEWGFMSRTADGSAYRLERTSVK